MKETVFDVLVFLYENYLDTEQENVPEADALRQELLQIGFVDHQVDQAFDWMDALADRQPLEPIDASQITTFRVFSEDEQRRLDMEAQGMLMFLEQCGIVDPASRELIIERVMALGEQEISADHIRWVALIVLFNQPGMESAYSRLEELVYDDAPLTIH